jgi:hypothetical protein
MNTIVCTVCQQPDHRANRCPELSKDLQPGFYKPAGGMPQGGDDGDDEKLSKLWLDLRAKWITLASSTQALNVESKTRKTC